MVRIVEAAGNNIFDTRNVGANMVASGAALTVTPTSVVVEFSYNNDIIVGTTGFFDNGRSTYSFGGTGLTEAAAVNGLNGPPSAGLISSFSFDSFSFKFGVGPVTSYTDKYAVTGLAIDA